MYKKRQTLHTPLRTIIVSTF